MKFHRFDPYIKEHDQTRKDRAYESKQIQAWHKRTPEEREARTKRVQFKRDVTMRNKRVGITLPKITITLCLLLIMHPQPAGARCYSRWYYPTPQHCGVYNRVGEKHDLVFRLIEPTPMPPDRTDNGIPDFVLPDMNAMWGGAMDTELELQLQRQKALRQLGGE